MCRSFVCSVLFGVATLAVAVTPAVACPALSGQAVGIQKATLPPPIVNEGRSSLALRSSYQPLLLAAFVPDDSCSDIDKKEDAQEKIDEQACQKTRDSKTDQCDATEAQCDKTERSCEQGCTGANKSNCISSCKSTEMACDVTKNKCHTDANNAYQSCQAAYKQKDEAEDKQEKLSKHCDDGDKGGKGDKN